MLHISDITHYNKCPKSYYLNKLNKDSHILFFRNEYNIAEIYKTIFDFNDCFVGKVGDDPNLVLNALDKYKFFVNARFSNNNLRVKVSLLKKEGDNYSLYFFKPMLSKELDIKTLYVTFDILRKNGLKINKIYLIYINKDYVMKDEIDFSNALIVTESYNGSSIIDLVLSCTYDYLEIINEIDNYQDYNINQVNMNCSSCEYFESCCGNILHDDSIMHLVSSKYKYNMYKEGIISLKDTDINRIDGTSLQYAQIMATRNGGLFIDKNKLKDFMKTIESDVISFIDFEWDCFMFPKYNNMKCFDLLPFEFSLYVKNSDKLLNYCYVGKNDCRREFIETLLEKLPSTGPIVAFNSFSAEVLRLKELAIQFPEYSEKINNIVNRFVDIAEVFSKGYVYDVRFKGQLSLKSIDSVISDISYSELKIKNGLDAIVAFRKFEITNNEDMKNELIKYCNQDAYSLLVIYNYLLNLI